jgi:hypothetical protein
MRSAFFGVEKEVDTRRLAPPDMSSYVFWCDLFQILNDIFDGGLLPAGIIVTPRYPS